MKKIIFLPLVLFCTFSIGQTLPNYEEIKFEKASDYKDAEPAVMQAADFILTRPFRKDDLQRLQSLQFIMKWMEGTPDFTFALDEVASKICKGNDELLGVYLACMTKYCLENRESAKDEKTVKLNSINFCWPIAKTRIII